MAITKQLVGILGGTIQVESTLGAGTRFVIEMDIDIDPEAHKAEAQTPQDISIDGMRVLLV